MQRKKSKNMDVSQEKEEKEEEKEDKKWEIEGRVDMIEASI